MKRIYNKPMIEITNLVERYGIMRNNSEPEVTENIGAKENNFDIDWDNINNFGNLWEDDTDIEED